MFSVSNNTKCGSVHRKRVIPVGSLEAITSLVLHFNPGLLILQWLRGLVYLEVRTLEH